MDATYKSELRELNELNFARFDAKLEQRLAQLGAELRTEFRSEIGGVRTTISEARSDLLKWSFVFWVGAVGAIAMLAKVLP